MLLIITVELHLYEPDGASLDVICETIHFEWSTHLMHTHKKKHMNLIKVYITRAPG